MEKKNQNKIKFNFSMLFLLCLLYLIVQCFGNARASSLMCILKSSGFAAPFFCGSD